MTNNIDRFADAIAEITANKLGLNTHPDPDVAAWMESMGFRQVPNRFDHGKHFVNDDMGGEIDEYQAAFFYHAQQRAVVEGRIDEHSVLDKYLGNEQETGRGKRRVIFVEDLGVRAATLEAQLQNNKEGKL